MEFTFKRPDAIAALSAGERETSCKETDDLCAIWGDAEDSHRFYVRGLLPLPVVGRETPYNLGIWLEVSKKSFDRILELWEDVDQANEPPIDGRLANAVPFQLPTVGLAGLLHLTGPSTRPNFLVTDSLHAMYTEQVHGISLHQAHAYSSKVA